MRYPKGTSAKLSDWKLAEMRAAWAGGASTRELAARYGLSTRQVDRWKARWREER